MGQFRRRLAARAPLFAALLALAIATVVAHAAGAPRPGGHDQFIVKFRHGDAAQRQSRLDAAGRAQGLRIGTLRRMAVGADVVRTDRVLDAAQARALLARLRADPRVEYAEVDARVVAHFDPGDPSFAAQWHLHEATAGINVPDAWDTTTAPGQVVAVLDTGITPHVDLSANLVAGYDFITSTRAARDGDARDANPNDEGDWYGAGECSQVNGASSTWHGTHVAGTVAAVGMNSIGVVGVAFDAKVQPVRVLGKCGGTSSDLADAIVWAAGLPVAGVPANATPAKVIQLALGGTGACPASTQAAIDQAVAQGATIIASAGNGNVDAANQQPANCNHVVTVAALDRAGARATYSNHGATIDLAAPGGGGADAVLSTTNTGTTVQAAPTYGGYNGTSMAAAHVAGVAALVRSVSGDNYTPAQVEALLEATSRALPVACAPGCGAGLVDAEAAVLAAGLPMLRVRPPVALIHEGDSGSQPVTFTVELTQPASGDVTFDIATADGTASAGSDYDALSLGAQVIPAGSTSATFDVAVLGDIDFEAGETFSVVLANASGPIGPVVGDTATATIRDDDPQPLTANVPRTGIADDVLGAPRRFTLFVPEGAHDLQFSISGGTGDVDLYVRAQQPPDLSTYDCAPKLAGNAETCAMAVQAGPWHVLLGAAAPYSGVTLVGSYTAPVDLSIGNASVTEGQSGTKVMTFTVSLSGVAQDPVTYDIGTQFGSAFPGVDFVEKQLAGQAIPVGQTSKAFTVVINGDTDIEANETFPVWVGNVHGAQVVDFEGVGTIVNDDGPTLSIGDAAVTEGNAGTKAMTFTVSLSQASASAVTYDIATANNTAQAGSDYIASALTGQSIPAGQLSKTFSVTLNGDTTVEANEILRANLANASVSITDAQGTGTILNDDGPTLSVSDAGFVEGNSGTKVLQFTVSLSQASPSAVTYNIATSNGIATAGNDFVASSLTGQTIPAGHVSKTFSVTVNGDTAIEGNETFFVVLSAASVSLVDGQGKGTITNDDGPVLSISDAQLTEADSGSTQMTFTVSISQVAPAPVSFNFSTANGTALAGPDFVPVTYTGLKIPTGQLSKTVVVFIKGDLVVEPNETLVGNISMGNVSIKDGVGIGTIINND